jgi:superoxide reductase
MTEAHYIEWIAIETNQGVHRKNLTPSSKPQAEFALVSGETVKDVYAYCNLHGLWKA